LGSSAGISTGFDTEGGRGTVSDDNTDDAGDAAADRTR
jgi:hypothetical protein